MDWVTFKKNLKLFWWFIWEDDSVWSWLVNVVLAFVIIKFIVYPGLGFLLNTGYPIVAVVSGSMEHDGNFDQWWSSAAICSTNERCTQEQFYAEYNISKEEFRNFRFRNGFNKGDIMVLYGVKTKDLKIGDVLVFNSFKPDPIIHRVVRIYEMNGMPYFQTKGDHNPKSFDQLGGIDETRIQENQIQNTGKAVLRIPYLGYIKIWFMNLICLFGNFNFCIV
jgi:hypothetical protein